MNQDHDNQHEISLDGVLEAILQAIAQGERASAAIRELVKNIDAQTGYSAGDNAEHDASQWLEMYRAHVEQFGSKS